MKKLIFITVLIACVMAISLEADFLHMYDYTWKIYSQEKAGSCCGCSDSNIVYLVTEIRFTADGKVYNKYGTIQIGTWNDYEGSLDGRVYFSPAINGVSYFDFTHTDWSLMMIGGNDTKNIWCLRNNRI